MTDYLSTVFDERLRLTQDRDTAIRERDEAREERDAARVLHEHWAETAAIVRDQLIEEEREQALIVADKLSWKARAEKAEAALVEARDALRPFAEAYKGYEHWQDYHTADVAFSIADLRRAARVLGMGGD